MRRIIKLIAPALAFAATNAQAEDFGKYPGTYFCTPSAGAGLYYNEAAKTWDSTTFAVKGMGYIVKLSDTGRKVKRNILRYAEPGNKDSELEQVPGEYPVVTLTVKEKGAEYTQECQDLFKEEWDRKDTTDNEIIMLGSFLTCFGRGPRFQFDFDTLRFQSDGRGGYISGKPDKENTDTPFIFIGTCDKID